MICRWPWEKTSEKGELRRPFPERVASVSTVAGVLLKILIVSLPSVIIRESSKAQGSLLVMVKDCHFQRRGHDAFLAPFLADARMSTVLVSRIIFTMESLNRDCAVVQIAAGFCRSKVVLSAIILFVLPFNRIVGSDRLLSGSPSLIVMVLTE